ncbi:MFS transporter [Pseudomonas frederiksbergensis]|uniref:MFS transporter n=1 Tax=Pseudomonas frederiksbergensis TaxID=104087 RepID=UPI003D209B72
MGSVIEREHSATGSMALGQWAVIGMCMLFNMINGLDTLATAFVLSSLSAEWALNGFQQGILLSASLIGMASGSTFAAPMADRHGRRPLLLASLLLSGTTMLLSFWAQGPWSLALLRALTGIGVGATLVGANVLTYEHASLRRRGLAISLQSVAFALGVSLGGLLAHALNETVGWRYVFLAGGSFTLAAGLTGALWLRESFEFLAVKSLPAQQADHRPALSNVATNSPVPSLASQRLFGRGYRQHFSTRQWRETISLATAFFLVMFCFYFVVSWTPTLLVQTGASETHGIKGGMLLNTGGMLGALLLGLGANRYGSRQLLLGFLLLNAVLMTLMVPATQVLSLAIGMGFTLGLLLNGAIAGLYILAPQIYGTGERASGVGLVLGLGRLGSILSPVVAGVLLDAHWSSQALFTFYASSLLLAALAIAWGRGGTEERAGRSRN